MLRKDEVMALDEVTEACETAADHYEAFAGAVERRPLREMFLALARGHRDQVAQLDRLVRGLDELPTRPDTDRETLERVAVWLRGALAEQEHTVLLEKAAETEAGIKRKTHAALQQDQSEAARTLLQRIATDADAALARIAAARNAQQ